MNPLLLVKLIGSIVLCLALVAGGAYGGYRWESGKVDALKAADAKATVLAVKAAATRQEAQDRVNAAANFEEAESQQKIVTRTVTLTKEILVHVPDHSDCITYGLVRVLNAAASAAGTDAVPAPAGQSDDTCAPVSWRDFAADLVRDYGTGQENAGELNGLQGWITKQEAIAPQK